MEPGNPISENDQSASAINWMPEICEKAEALRKKVKALQLVVELLLKNILTENSPDHVPSAENHVHMQYSVVNRHLDDIQLFGAKATFEAHPLNLSEFEQSVFDMCFDIVNRLSTVLVDWSRFLILQLQSFDERFIDGGKLLYSEFEEKLHHIKASANEIYAATKLAIKAAGSSGSDR